MSVNNLSNNIILIYCNYENKESITTKFSIHEKEKEASEIENNSQFR
jgi:hypothetical protein